MLERLDQFLLKCLNHSSSSNFLVTYKTYKKVWKKKLKMAASAGSMKPHAHNHMSFFYSKSTCHQAHWIVGNSSTAFFGNVLFLTASWTKDHTFRSIWWCIILQRNPQFHPFTQIKLDNTSLLPPSQNLPLVTSSGASVHPITCPPNFYSIKKQIKNELFRIVFECEPLVEPRSYLISLRVGGLWPVLQTTSRGRLRRFGFLFWGLTWRQRPGQASADYEYINMNIIIILHPSRLT